MIVGLTVRGGLAVRRRWWTAVAVGAALALAAAACGRSGSTTAAPTSPPATSPTTRAGPGPGTFGSLAAVCGPGSARGATDQGVTDTGIEVGTMADPGAAAAPGLDQELFDTAKAFVGWCNAAGGILGRKLALHQRDSKLFEVAARMVEACQTDFSLVGNGEAFDDAGVDQRVKCRLPEIPAYDNSVKATEAPLKVQATSLPTDEQTVAIWKAARQALGVTRIGWLTGNITSITVTKSRFREAVEQTGFKSVYDEIYPVTGMENPQSYVQRMKDAGVEVLTQTGDVSALIQLEKAMQTVGWYPKAIIEAPQQYDTLLIKNGADAVKNTWVYTNYVPFEAAAQNPATQQYLDIMKQSGGKVAALGLNAFDAWLLFATAARDCGSSLTRSCLLQKAGAHPSWDAGGLKAPNSTDPTNRHMTECYLAMKAGPSGFSIDQAFLPPKGSRFFNCDPGNVVTLTGNYAPKS